MRSRRGVPDYTRLQVDCWELDLADYASVIAFAQRAETELDKVDILMSNAA